MKKLLEQYRAIREQLRHKYVKFGFAGTLYFLWVIWVGSYWLFIGLPIVYDIYVSKKVNWTPWKRRDGKKNSTIVEWIDALIFAVVAVTIINIFLFQNYKIPTGSMEKRLLIGDHLYVTKLKYGPKLPNTPIAFPFTQNIMPFSQTMPSFVTWPNWGYKRLKGFTSVKNDDIVVFNFPEGDTVALELSASSYYAIVREFSEQFKMRDIQMNTPLRSKDEYQNLGRKYVWENYTMTVRPIDRRDNYIKRCVAIAGDSLQVKDGQLFINGKSQKKLNEMQLKNRVITDGSPINPEALDRLAIYPSDVESGESYEYIIPLTEEKAAKIREFSNVKSVEKIIRPKGEYLSHIFPHNPAYPWNEDNFGPLYIPKQGATVKIDTGNICLYQRIIEAYEANKLQIKGKDIFINDKLATSYTFKQNYYFMMGDNRHNSADSRFWGYVPEDHVVGAPKFIWLSLDPTKKFPANIRWKRMFTSASE